MNGINMQHKPMKKTLIPKMIRVQGDLGKRKTYLSNETQALAANPTSDNIPRVMYIQELTQETLQQSQQQIFPTTISLWEDSPVRLLAWLDSAEDFLKPEELYSRSEEHTS